MKKPSLKFPIYMDYHSTTPVDQRVLQEMLPYFSGKFGNAASTNHLFGWEAEEAVTNARNIIATSIGALPEEIIFTSSATESVNLALKGICNAFYSEKSHVITAATEHKAVLDTCSYLLKRGVEISVLPVDNEGFVNPDDIKKALRKYTRLISIMHANNEIGSIAPISEIGLIAKENGIFFHSDATQSIGKIPVNVKDLNLDMISFSAHKIYGPKGIGALYIRKGEPRIKLSPLIHGGGHEKGLRSGTLNIPAIVGFAKACEIAVSELIAESKELSELRNLLREKIFSLLDKVHLNGPPKKRLPGNLNLSFDYVEGESILLGMREVALSSGSACTSAVPEPSHVIRALGFGDERAHNAVRFGLGRFTTEEEVLYVAEKIVSVAKKLRSISPMSN